MNPAPPRGTCKMCLAERSFLRPGGPPYSADPPSNNAKSMRFGPFGVRIDCHAPAPEGEWGQICGTFTAVGRPKTPNTVLQTRRAQKRFNLASVRLSKMGKHHSFSYGFCTFSGSSGSTPTVRPQRSWEPLFGPLVSAWHPFCHSKFFENLRRSLPAEADGANSVHRYRC